MSNTKVISESKIEKSKFLTLEHGTKYITISMSETHPHVDLRMELTLQDAQLLAEELTKRVNEIFANQ